MRPSAHLLYAALALTVAVAYGITFGPFWRVDALVMAVGSMALAWFYLKRADWSSPHSLEREYIPRSRIAHYFRMSTIDISPVVLSSYDSFERRLMSNKDWRTMSAEELALVVKESASTVAAGKHRQPSEQ